MTATCETTRSRLPEWARGVLDSAEAESIDAHLRGCTGCADESELVALLYMGRPAVPGGLAASVRARISGRGRSGARLQPWWGLAAAAVAAVALGIGVNSSGDPAAMTVPIYAAESGSSEAWLSADGDIAGAPALDDLSDDELMALLDDLSDGGEGGAA